MREDFRPYLSEIESGLMEDKQQAANQPTAEAAPPPVRRAKPAAAFGEDNTRFLWFPFLPVGDYSVLMAEGGTGKTVLCCGLAAAVSTGKPLPGEEFDRKPGNTLIISAEDRGEVLKKRLVNSGADLTKVFILDCSDSIGMDFTENYAEFKATVQAHCPALVIVDPWHGFLGDGVNIDRVNVMRPVLQKLAHLAKECQCAMILVSHVNKRSQGENVNNAAQGSADFINAARSAFRVIFDGDNENSRILVHTKSNYAPYGKSVLYRIEDGGVVWDGFSDITRQTLELAARRRAAPWEVMQQDQEHTTASKALVGALKHSANQFVPTRYTYDEFKQMHGDLIFGALQPKKALDAVKNELEESGFFLRTGIQVKKGGRKDRGFLIQRVDTTEPEQVEMSTQI